MTNHGGVVLPCLPHSPDITPCDIFLFAQLKKILHCCHSINAKDITATTLGRKMYFSTTPRALGPLAEVH
jgi:hypothetical protein